MLVNKLINKRILYLLPKVCTSCKWNYSEQNRIINKTVSVKSFSSVTITKCCVSKFDFIQKRYKYNKKADEDEKDEIEEEQNLEEFSDGGKDSKLAKIKVGSLRTDLIIKSGLGLARNKVETAFYDSKIRVNGKKLQKKSSPVKIGDEIDVIKGLSTFNPDNIVVSRIEIVSASAGDENISVVLRKFKSLTIENYENEHAFKAHSQVQD